MRSHRQIAVHLDATGLPVTYLAPNLFMENLLEAAGSIRSQGTIFAPAGQGRVGFVAASDVAKVAAAVLTSAGHEDQTYVLTGPESLTYADVAARVSAVFARDVDYDDMPGLLAKDQMLAGGLSPLADPWHARTVRVDPALPYSVTSTVREVTGQDPQDVDDWLSDQRSAFLARSDPLS